MPIKHGQYIDAQTVESETSRWDGARFETLWNAYVWSLAPHAQLTSVINAADGGVDAEVTMGEDWDETINPVLKRGRNVFQFKKRTKPLSPSEVKGEFKRLNSNSPLSKYILVTNLCLTRVKIQKLKESIADGLEPPPLERIQIIDAGLLSAFLNNNPHIRSAFFTENSFQTWQSTYESFQQGFLPIISPLVDLVGRERELDTLKQFLLDENVRCIVVSGPPMIGKSRLVLEGLKSIQNQVVYALSPDTLGSKELEWLTNPKDEVVCVVEDPDLQKVQEINRLAFQIPRLKIVITLPTRDQSIHANYGFDPRTQVIEVKPLSWEQSRHLMHLSRQFIPETIEEWILRQAEGVPGLLLLAISQLEIIREHPSDFIQQIGAGIKDRIQYQFGEESIEVLKRLSLFTHVGVSGEYADEIDRICQVFQGVDVNKVLNCCQRIVNAGLVQQKGDFLEVSIPLFANQLASELLLGNFDKLLRLIVLLKPSTSFRLFARISGIQNDVTQKLWDDLFATFFNDFDRLIKHAEMVEYLAGTVPEKVLRCLEAFLLKSDYDFRLNIKEENRRNLMWVLEQLLYRKKTSYGALRLIGLLAEAENETWSNNATGLFFQCFHYLQPQLPLTYMKRLVLLKELISYNREKATLLAIQAINKSFDQQSWSHVTSKGYFPFDDHFQPEVWGEIFDYARQLLDLIWYVAISNGLCSKDAFDLLPQYLSDIYVIDPNIADLSVNYFEKVAELIKNPQSDINVFSLSEYIEFTLDIVPDEISDEIREQYLPYMERLKKILNNIQHANFELCLKRLVSDWSRSSDTDDEKNEFIKLAGFVIHDPAILTEKIWYYLLSPEAQRNYQFFFAIGNQDNELSLWDTFIDKLNSDKYGYLFSQYFVGYSHLDFENANRIWDDRIDCITIAPIIWIQTLVQFKPTENRIKRLIYKLTNHELDQCITANALRFNKFLGGLSNRQFHEIIQALAGSHYEYALFCLRLLDWWIYQKREITEDLKLLGWHCIENLLSVKDNLDSHRIDKVSAYLTKLDPERGYSVFKNALIRSSQSKRDYYKNEKKQRLWEPVNSHTHHEFADTLRQINPEKFYRIFLELAGKENNKYIGSEYLMKAYLNLDRDYDVILKLAKELKENAIIISNWISSQSKRFYDFVNEIVPQYPTDEDIKYNFSKGIEQLSMMHKGPYHEFLNSLLPDIDKRIEDQNTHIVVREWLKDIKEGLLKQIGRHIVWDYHEDIVSLRRHIDDQNSEMRLWAIGRILEKGTLYDIKELLTVDEIVEALPRIKLPTEKKEIFERMVRIWKNEI